MSSAQQKWLLIIVVILALNAGIWFLGIAPTRTAIAEVDRQTAALEQKETQLLERLASLEAIDTEALELEQLEQLIKIPAVGFLREMMTELEAVASEMDNELKSMGFQPPAPEGVFQSMEIALMLSGEYENLFAYIKYLETHPRLIFVNSLNLGGDEGELNANIQLLLFANDFGPYTPHQAPGRANPFKEQ